MGTDGVTLDAPLRLVPQVLAKPWGGGELLGRFGVQVPTSPPTGEVWLVSDVPGRPSVVAEGPHKGRTLADLVHEHQTALLGRARGGRFPLLVKLLEVTGRLSVQVHPTADVARANGDGPSGKFEAWAVLDAAPGARVALGLDRSLEPESVRTLVAEGRLHERLNQFTPTRDDAYVIAPGTIHAATGGVLFLEVQETADVTYRLYDWGTVGLDGRPRELHVDKALACADLVPRDPRRPLPPSRQWLGPGASRRPIVAEREGPFAFDVLELRGSAASVGGGDVPWILVGLEGRATIRAGTCELVLAPGEALLWPAALPPGAIEARWARVARATPSVA